MLKHYILSANERGVILAWMPIQKFARNSGSCHQGLGHPCLIEALRQEIAVSALLRQCCQVHFIKLELMLTLQLSQMPLARLLFEVQSRHKASAACDSGGHESIVKKWV